MKEIANIDFEDLFGNLLIILKRSGIEVNKVSYSLIDQFGTIILKNLKSKDIGVNFKLNNENIDTFLKENSKYYEDSKTDGSIIILNNMPIDKMILKYQVCLPSFVLKGMYNDEVVCETLEAYINELVISNQRKMDDVQEKIKAIGSKENN